MKTYLLPAVDLNRFLKKDDLRYNNHQNLKFRYVIAYDAKNTYIEFRLM